MTRQTSKSLWTSTATDTPEWQHLDDNIDVDVVVIGGGFTGVSAAFHLAVGGASVALLEAHTIGFGGSGRNVGLVNAGLWTPPDEVEQKLGKKAGEKLNSILSGGPDIVFGLIEQLQIQCEAERQGTLHCAHSQAGLCDLEKRFAQQQTRKAPVKLLNASETVSRTGSEAYCGALWDGRAGTIQPLAYVQGLAQAASQLGAQIFENSSAISVEEDGSGWRVKTTHGEVKAARLIQATNAYTTDGAPKNNIIPAYFFQLATAPIPENLLSGILGAREGCWDTAMIMSSFRLDQAGRMIFGAFGNLDGLGRQAHATWAMRKLIQLFPQLKNVPFERSWTGRIAMTSSYLPRVEQRGALGISIFGYSGRGISPGTIFGAAAADWAMGKGELPMDLNPPTHEPNAAAKSAYYEFGSVMTHLVNARL